MSRILVVYCNYQSHYQKVHNGWNQLGVQNHSRCLEVVTRPFDSSEPKSNCSATCLWMKTYPNSLICLLDKPMSNLMVESLVCFNSIQIIVFEGEYHTFEVLKVQKKSFCRQQYKWCNQIQSELSGAKFRFEVWRSRTRIRYHTLSKTICLQILTNTISGLTWISAKFSKYPWRNRQSKAVNSIDNSIIHITRTIRYTSGIWFICKNCKTSSPVEVNSPRCSTSKL